MQTPPLAALAILAQLAAFKDQQSPLDAEQRTLDPSERDDFQRSKEEFARELRAKLFSIFESVFEFYTTDPENRGRARAAASDGVRLIASVFHDLPSAGDQWIRATWGASKDYDDEKGKDDFASATVEHLVASVRTANQAIDISEWALDTANIFFFWPETDDEQAMDLAQRAKKVHQIITAPSQKAADRRILALRELDIAEVFFGELLRALDEPECDKEKLFEALRQIVRAAEAHVGRFAASRQRPPSLSDLMLDALVVWPQTEGGSPGKKRKPKWKVVNDMLASIGIGAPSAATLKTAWASRPRTKDDERSEKMKADFRALQSVDRRQWAFKLADICREGGEESAEQQRRYEEQLDRQKAELEALRDSLEAEEANR
jgi:hypothetical protein